MPRLEPGSPSRRPWRIAAAAGVVAALLLTVGLAQAATAAAKPAPLTACADSKGRLVPPNSKHACRKGTHRVTVARSTAVGKTGPAGAQGAPGQQGAPGATGPQGPGALALAVSSTTPSASLDDPATRVRITMTCASAAPVIRVAKTGTSFDPFTVSGSGYLVNGAQTTTTVTSSSTISVGTPAFGFVRAVGVGPSDFFEVSTPPSGGLAITSGRLFIDRTVIVESGSTTAFAPKTSVLDYRFSSTSSSCSGSAQLTPSS